MAQRSTNRSIEAKKPVEEIRQGRVKAVIWENETDSGIRHNVTVARIYKDGEDWKESTSFGRDDLPLLQEVLHEAWKWVYDEGSSSQRGRDAA